MDHLPVILKTTQVCALTGLSRSTLWRLARSARSGFPIPVRLSPGLKGYRADDIERWISERHADAVAEVAERKAALAATVATKRKRTTTG